MIVRYEPWGAWVKLQSVPATIALDRNGVRALGLDGSPVWNAPEREGASPRAPIEAHVAVTSRCGAGCKDCYMDARVEGTDPSLEALARTLDALRDAGVFTVAFGGGEPTLRSDLDQLAAMATDRGLTPVLTTSGLGLSGARLDKLRGFSQVNVSYDGPAGAYEKVRGFDGAAAAEGAVSRLASAGVRVGVNVVLTRDSFTCVHETVSRARSLGAREAQLLRYKPAGRAASLDYLANRMTLGQRSALGPLLRTMSARECAGGSFHLRIDCALVPFLSADADLAARPEALEQFGVFGCEAAGALASVTVTGHVAPCSFAPHTSLPVERLATDYAHHADLVPWRRPPADPDAPCATCSLRSLCKGGCKIVSGFLGDRFGPDPECPRVEALRAIAREPAREAGEPGP